jgi:hypothetical protein
MPAIKESQAPAPEPKAGKAEAMMKAVAVYPGKPNTMHLREVARPSVDEIPEGRGVLVKVFRVGVDGTDKEINAAEYGMAPPGTTISSPGTRASVGSWRSGPT